jgi:hypothetical protein
MERGYVGMWEEQTYGSFHSYTSDLDGEQQSPSHTDRFTSGEGVPITLAIELRWFRSMEKRHF